MRIIRNKPKPVDTTYDIVGLSHHQMRLLRTSLGAINSLGANKDRENGTGVIFDALNEMGMKPFPRSVTLNEMGIKPSPRSVSPWGLKDDDAQQYSGFTVTIGNE